MADIAPVVPTVQVAPAAAVATAAPGSPQAFIGQLAAALKTLKGLTSAAISSTPAAPTDAPAATAEARDDTDTSPPAPSTPDDVLELLASLGLVPAPELTPPTPPAAKGSSAASGPAAPSLSPASVTVPPPSTPTSTSASASTSTSNSSSNSASTFPSTSTSELSANGSSSNSTSTFPSTSTSEVSVNGSGGSATGTPRSASATSTTSPGSPSSLNGSGGSVAGPQPHTAHALQPPVSAPQTGFQPNTDSGDPRGGAEQHFSEKPASPDAAQKPTDTTSTPTPDRVFTVAAPATTPQSPANVQPAQVASQIAQQVDLYRLPGNKGVRIQLHPEDLGGVQVTLHYASGGNLELHINVEHAATGALVQAGMPQLRDALASQGFHPDRLVMSVSAPSAAGQMDFSSNNNNDGSYRSDTSAMAAFTQNGQSNSQRNNDDGSDGPAFRGWNGATDPSPSTTINEATSTGVGSTSRIDYRV